MLTVMRLEEALEKMKVSLIDETTHQLSLDNGCIEYVSLHKAVGRVIAGPILAPIAIPHFRRSTVDGYALRAADCKGASDFSPMLVPVAFHVSMGLGAPRALLPGECAYVPTGGHVPDGADAVVMVEWTQEMGDSVLIERSLSVGDHVVQIGEDVREGECVLSPGTTVTSAHLGVLAALGLHTLCVKKPLKAVVYSSGDELLRPEPLKETTLGYSVFDANTWMVVALLQAQGVDVVHTGHLRDEQSVYDRALNEWVGHVDLIVLSGGSSAGTRDFTESAFLKLEDSELLVHGLAIQPGKPTLVATSKKTALVGLPGHPGACYIVAKVLLEPYIQMKMQGRVSPQKKTPCTLDFALHGSSGREVYQLVELMDTHDGKLAKAVYGKSGMVSAMAKANAYIVLPMMQEGLKPGDQVEAVYL